MWPWIVLAITTVVEYFLAPKPEKPDPTTVDDLQVPNSEEGQPIRIPFGTPHNTAPAVAFYDNLRLAPIKAKGAKK